MVGMYPRAHLVYGLNTVLFAMPFEVGARQVTGGPVPLVEGVREATEGQGAAQFSVSTSARWSMSTARREAAMLSRWPGWAATATRR